MKTLEQIIEREKANRTEGGQFGITACKESIQFYLEHGSNLEDLLEEYVERANEDPFFNKAMILACWEMLEEKRAQTNAYFEALMNNGEKKSCGQGYAIRAWSRTREQSSDMFEVEYLPWGSELKAGAMEEFVETLKEAGITEFAVTDQATSLMTSLHALFAAGGTLVCPVTVTRSKDWIEASRAGLLVTIH